METLKSKNKGSAKKRKHLNCTCNACQLVKHPGFQYLCRFPELASLDSKELVTGKAPSHQAIATKWCTLAADAWLPYALIYKELRAGRGFKHMPGFIVSARIADGKCHGYFLEPVELVGQEVSDGGLAVLRGARERASARLAEMGEGPANIAAWLTGLFEEETPVHVLVCGVGDECMFALATDFATSYPVSVNVMAASLQRLQRKYSHLRPAPLSDTEPTSYSDGVNRDISVDAPTRFVAAMLQTSRAAADYHRSLVDDAEAHARATEKLKADILAERRAFEDEALRRRRAAVATKNAEIDKVSSKVRILEREVSQLKGQLRTAQQAALPTMTTESGRSQHSPSSSDDASIVVCQPPLVVLDDDHWRETSEHQAEVIRQLRLALLHSPRPDTSSAVSPAEAPKRSMRELADWAGENADRVIVLSRAVNAAKKSVYHDDAFAFEALTMLATTYRDVKLGIQDRMALKRRCDQLGLAIGGSIDEGVCADYHFDWRGRRRFLDQHIGKGNSRDPRYCFRAYFTWDDEECKVIIGWAPAHLDTRAT